MSYPAYPYVSFPDKLPAPANKSRRLCVEFGAQWLPYLLGCVFPLLSENTWQDGDLTSPELAKDLLRDLLAAKDCGNRPPDIVADVDEGMRLRVNPDNPCEIQTECAPDQWEKFWSAEDCSQSSAGTGPFTRGSLAPGQCKEYDIVIDASGITPLPITVNDGYVINITNVRGAWTDNSAVIPGFPRWQCPNGAGYALGECTSVFGPLYPDDAAPTLPHMRVIMNVAGVFTDAYNSIYTVPSGTGEVDVFFQANDSNIGDNSGTVLMHVSICNGGEPTWTSVLDFRESSYPGFVTLDHSTYIDGEGVQGTAQSAHNHDASLYFSWPSGAHLTSVIMQYTAGGSIGPNNKVGTYDAAGYTHLYAPHQDTVAGTSVVQTFATDETGIVWFGCDVNTGDSAALPIIEKVTLNGKGPKPPNLP